MGVHCHSSGSGRIMTTLTRDGGEKFFNTVVFDGGPVFAYIPWYCETDNGPLGPRPENYTIDGGNYGINVNSG